MINSWLPIRYNILIQCEPKSEIAAKKCILKDLRINGVDETHALGKNTHQFVEGAVVVLQTTEPMRAQGNAYWQSFCWNGLGLCCGEGFFLAWGSGPKIYVYSVRKTRATWQKNGVTCCLREKYPQESYWNQQKLIKGIYPRRGIIKTTVMNTINKAVWFAKSLNSHYRYGPLPNNQTSHHTQNS